MTEDNGRRYHVMLKADRPDCSDVYLTGYSMPHPEAVTFMSKVSTPRPAGQRLMLEEIPKGFRWTPEQALIPVMEAALGIAGVPLEMNRAPSRAQVVAYLVAAGFSFIEGQEYRNAEGMIVDVWPEAAEAMPDAMISTMQDIAMAATEEGSAAGNWSRVAGVLCQVEVKA